MNLNSLRFLAVGSVGSGALWCTVTMSSAASPQPGGPASPASGSATTRAYTMSGRVRPLLFWIGRDDIGLARIVWRRGANGARGYEFLVGTDPARAPRSLNRWGYISERADADGGDLFALMTTADAASYDDAVQTVADDEVRGQFRAISGTVRAGAATSRVAVVRTADDMTVHDVAAAIERLQPVTAAATARAASLPDRIRPGFLTAVAELIEANSASPGDGRRTGAGLRQLRYVFGQSLYELRLRRLSDASGDGVLGAVHGEFEIRTIATDARTRFDITWGTSGPLNGVPLHIAWQPRWWLKVDLRLDDPAAAAMARR